LGLDSDVGPGPSTFQRGPPVLPQTGFQMEMRSLPPPLGPLTSPTWFCVLCQSIDGCRPCPIPRALQPPSWILLWQPPSLTRSPPILAEFCTLCVQTCRERVYTQGLWVIYTLCIYIYIYRIYIYFTFIYILYRTLTFYLKQFCDFVYHLGSEMLTLGQIQD
jgi:hypothetical protein